MPERQQQEGAEELGGWDCARLGAPGLCQQHWQHGEGPRLVRAVPRHRACPPRRCLTLQSSTRNCCSLPWGQSICPTLHRQGAELYSRR